MLGWVLSSLAEDNCCGKFEQKFLWVGAALPVALSIYVSFVTFACCKLLLSCFGLKSCLYCCFLKVVDPKNF